MNIFPDFSRRSHQEEIMDELEIEGYEVEQALRELAIINRWLGGQNTLINGLNKLKPSLKALSDPVKIADLGCGGGDLLQLVGKWASKQNLPVTLTGIDANPNIIRFAENWISDPEINFQSEDIFSESFQSREFDVVLMTLFCHHFTDQTLVNFLKQLQKQTSTAILINDLHRDPVPYYFTKGLVNLCSKSSMVKNDGPLSVLRAFKRKDLEKLLKEAGLTHYRITWLWAYRWQVLIWT